MQWIISCGLQRALTGTSSHRLIVTATHAFVTNTLSVAITLDVELCSSSAEAEKMTTRSPELHESAVSHRKGAT